MSLLEQGQGEVCTVTSCRRNQQVMLSNYSVVITAVLQSHDVLVILGNNRHVATKKTQSRDVLVILGYNLQVATENTQSHDVLVMSGLDPISAIPRVHFLEVSQIINESQASQLIKDTLLICWQMDLVEQSQIKAWKVAPRRDISAILQSNHELAVVLRSIVMW